MTIPQQIHAGQIPGAIVAQDELHIAFLDHEPITMGHTLVCPIQQVASIFDLDEEERTAFLNFAQGVEERLRRTLKPTGITQIMNDGPFNELDHLHLVPRYTDDGFEWIAKDCRKQSIEELQTVAAKLERNKA